MEAAHECRIRLTGPQTLARRTLKPRTTTALDWGRGCGKTTFTLLLWAMLVAEHDGKARGPTGKRGVRIVHLMPTFTQFKHVYAELIDEMFGPQGRFGWLCAKINRTNWHMSFPGGSWIQPFGTKEANRSRGMRCDVTTVDEADDVEPSVLDGIVKPWFSEPWSLGILLVEGTPRRGRHGLLWREVLAGRQGKPGHYSYHATYRDVPEHVSQEYVEQVKADTPPAVFAREWECDFDSAEGLVYSMFDEAFHVRPAPAGPWEEILVGVDHGWEDPGVFLVTGVQGHGRDAVEHVIEEVYERHKEESWWIAKARELKAKYQRYPMRWYGDPSRPDRIRAIGNGAGVRFYDTINAIEDGVSAVVDKMVVRVTESGEGDNRREHRHARLYVDPSCVNLIWEMRNYKRKPDPANRDRYLDEIEDKNNHCFIAGTMVTTDRGDVPIEAIRACDRVLTREGFYPVKAAGMTRDDAEVWTLVASDGRSLTGTPDHRIWTEESGWVRLAELGANDTLVAPIGHAKVFVAAQSLEAAPVYDLTVDGPPEFFANGILVHNCMDALRYLTMSRFGKPAATRHDSGGGWGG